MGTDLVESTHRRSIEKGERDDMSGRERKSREYDRLEESGFDESRESGKHKSKDKSRTSGHKEEKEHRSKDLERSRGKDNDYEMNRDRRRDDPYDRVKDKASDKVREKEYVREKQRERERKDWGKEKDRDKKVDSEKERDKERGKEKSIRDNDRDRDGKDRARDRDQEKHRERERERENGQDRGKNATERDKGKERDREKENQADAKDKVRDKDRSGHKQKDEGYERRKEIDTEGSPRLENHFAKGPVEQSDDEEGPKITKNRDKSDIVGSESHLSESQLEDRITRMRQERMTKSSEGAKSTEGASEILAWVSRNKKLEEKKKVQKEKEKAFQLSKMFEEQDIMNEENSDDEAVAERAARDLGGVKVLHGLDKVLEGGAVVLTLKDQSILADGDINQEVDMLENVEIGEQKRRNEAYKAAKKKSGIYDDKFSDDPGSERKILPHYDDPVADEGVTLDSSGRFTGEAERKLEELRRRIQGIPASSLGEDLSSTAKISTDYYTQEEIAKFKKPKKKKSLRKKEKLDLDSLEAEAISSGLGSEDLGSRHDGRRQKMIEEQERIEAERRRNAYQSAMARAEEASNALRLEQTPTGETEEEETAVFGDDDEELRKSLERARKIALKKQDETKKSGLQAISLLAASTANDSTVENTSEEQQDNKIVFAEVEEFVWSHQLNDDDEAKPLSEDVFMDEDIVEPNTSDKNMTAEDNGSAQLMEIEKDESPTNEEENEVAPDDTLHEAAVGKGLAGALKLLKDRGALKETVEWGGRNMDKKKSKLVGINEGDGRKEIRIERTDEYGRILTPKEAFRQLSHRFHGKGPGKMKQEKRMRQYLEELKIKQMKNADTPSLSVERMRETQAKLKTPYLVLSGHSKPGQDGDNGSGFATMERDIGGGLTPMLGDKKVEHFLNIKRKAEAGDSGSQKKPKT